MVWMRVNRDWAFDPFRELATIQREMNRMFDGCRGERAWPVLNVWAGQDEAVVTAEIPGVDPAKIDVSVKEDVLTLQGERAADELGEKDTYHRRERGHGTFTRSVRLPFPAEADGVKARYRHGVLEVHLPRREATKPRKIDIEAA